MRLATTNNFSAEKGFESPGFTISEDGNLVISGSLSFSGELISASGLTLNGVGFLNGNTLGSNIVNSSLTNLGTLTGLDVDGNVFITGNLTVNTEVNLQESLTVQNNAVIEGTLTVNNDVSIAGDFNLASGEVNITSATVGNLNNVNIGSTIPAIGNFTTLTTSSTLTLNPSTLGNIDNTRIGATTAATGRFTDVTIINAPTELTDATNKDYVDKNISALSIALGS